MGAPRVRIQEQDISTRVPGFPGVYGGIVIPAPKGKIGEPVFITSDTDLLRYFTPNEKVEVGHNMAFYSALAFLAKSNTLWVVRADNNSKFGGVVIKNDLATTNLKLNQVPIGDIDVVDQTGKKFTIDGDMSEHAKAGDLIKVIDSTGNNGIYTVVSTNVNDIPVHTDVLIGAITAVNQGTKTFTISGNHVSLLPDGATFTVDNSTGNDGSYTIVSATLNGTDTDIVVVEVIPDATVDGDIYRNLITSYNHTTDIVVSETIPSSTADGSINKNTVVNPEVYEFASDDVLLITGANAGAWANDISIELYTYADSPDVVKEPDAFLIQVYRQSTGELLETHLCSRDVNAKDGYGRNIYVEDIVKSSNYINIVDNTIVPSTTALKEQTTKLQLAGATDSSAITDSNMVSALNSLANKNEVLLTVVMDGGWTTPAYQIAIDSLCQGRQDCVACLSTPYSSEDSNTFITDIIDYRKTTLNLNSSYSSLCTPHVKISDRFNDRQIYIAPDGHYAGAISETSNNYEIWYAPAGFRRGVLNVLDVKRRFTEGQLDLLYDNGINPIKFVPGKGIAIWGQKTLSSRPSALDRLNVRLLLIVIEPAIAEFLQDFLFEFNDEFTRLLIKSGIESYMDNIKARRGVYSYEIVCDETNNTPQVIDENKLNVDLYVQPTKVAEFITLKVVITRTGFTVSV
jgi:hypothetical protein